MGRHGGGSRSGGRRGGSRSSGGGSSVTSVKTKPFAGCYNRSYYHKDRYHSCYTDNSDYGMSKSRLISKLILVIFFSVITFPFTIGLAFSSVEKGEKVNGNPDRIVIQDTIDLLSPEEEQKTLALFYEVYTKSGMPVTLYTDDMEWESKYDSIEIYSEELYYAMGIEEDAMIILFTYDGTFEWVYDMYCGDDTIRCLSDTEFNKLIDNFQKGMAGQDLSYALDYSFHSIMDDLAETEVRNDLLLSAAILTLFCSLPIGYFFSAYLKEKKAYQYFQENPEKVETTPMTVKYQCPSCGAHNSNLSEVCEYCGTVLKL